MKFRQLYIFFLSCIGLINSFHAFGQSQQNSFSEISKSFEKLEFSIVVNTVQPLLVENENGQFFKITLPNIEYTESKEVGKPTLPIILKNIEIPFESTPLVTIIAFDSVIYSLKNFDVEGLLFPAQASVFKNHAAKQFAVNEKVYSTNSFYSLPLADVKILGVLRGTQLGQLTFSPVSYNAVSGEIKVYTKFDVQIEFRNADANKVLLEKAKTYSVLQTSNPLKVLNPQNAKNLIREKEPVNYPVKYVIVAPDSFQNSVKEFVEWKREKGFEVLEVYTGSQMLNTTDDIKTYLSNLYHSSTPTNPAPSYLAIIGDTPQIPTFFVSSGTHHSDLGGHCTDLFYAEYTDDTYPELFYGRIPARNKVQLEAMLNKMLEYEKYEFQQGDSFLNNILLVAGKEAEEPFLSITNGQLNYLKQNYFDSTTSLTTSIFPNGVSENKVAEIETKLNAGGSLVNYTAHCMNDGWRNPSISTAKANVFSNANKYFFSINNCCWSSQFSELECFGEALLRNSNGGAIGVIGASNETLWQEDFYWSVGAYNLPETPVYSQNSLGAFDRFLHTHGENSNEWRASLGEILQAGNLAVTQSASLLDAFYWEIYNVLGDPSLMPYIGIPENLSIQISDSLPIGVRNIEITGTPYAYVALSADKELLATCLLDKDGTGTLSVSKTVVFGNLKIVATKQFAKPFVKNIPLFSPNEAYLVLWDYSVENAENQKTDSIKIDETLTLRVQLKNVGKTTYLQPKVKIVSASENLQVNKTEYIFDSIESGEIRTQNFVITANSKIKNLSVEKLLLSINNQLEKEIPLLGLAPRIKFSKIELNNTCEENNNYNLTLYLENAGSVALKNATLEVTPFFKNGNNFGTETFSINSLIPSEQVFFSFTTDCAMALQEEWLNILVATYTAEGFQQKDTLVISLMKTTEDFETSDFNKHAWMQKGNGWTIEDNQDKVFGGSYSARSNTKKDFTSSILSINLNVIQSDTLSFFYKISSEAGYDELFFSIDNQIMNKWSGEIDWKKCEYLLSTGKHSIEWKYVKDVANSEGSDAAWIDNIIFPPYGRNLSIFTTLTKNAESECIVYPNPAKNILNVSLINPQKIVSIEVFNAVGKKMKVSYNQINEGKGCSIDTHLYPKGIYFLILQTQNAVLQKKFIIVR